MVCPLCHSETEFYFEDKKRSYEFCSKCHLVHVPAVFHLSLSEEKAIYDLHENDEFDSGYRRFLNRLAEPLLNILKDKPVGYSGLDFGCGPEPVLAKMLQDKGCSMRLYDLYYEHNLDVFNYQYDFITATEVVEHLSQPMAVIENLWENLKQSGLLALMTKKVIDKDAFSRWHYKNDPTHICFFSDQTFQYLAKKIGAEILYSAKDVVIFKKL